MFIDCFHDHVDDYVVQDEYIKIHTSRWRFFQQDNLIKLQNKNGNWELRIDGSESDESDDFKQVENIQGS